MDLLTRTEELLLLAVWKLQQEAYGLAIRRHMAGLLGHSVSVWAVYIPMERLARQGLLATWESEPTERRGGRRKRFYKLTPMGVAALNAVRQVQDAAWAGLPDLSFGAG
jgi:DNA-binding PadR family transcriptional regulator